MSDEVRLVGLEELVDVASGRIVHGVGASGPADTADVTALRSGEEFSLAEYKSVVFNGKRTFDSQNTELREEDNCDTGEGDVALEIVNTLGVARVDGDGEAVEDLNARSDIDDGRLEGELGGGVARSVGDVGVITSVPFATRVLETFVEVGLIETLRSDDRSSNAAAV